MLEPFYMACPIRLPRAAAPHDAFVEYAAIPAVALAAFVVDTLAALAELVPSEALTPVVVHLDDAVLGNRRHGRSLQRGGRRAG